MTRLFATAAVLVSILLPLLIAGAWIISCFSAVEKWHSRSRYCMGLKIDNGGVLLSYDGGSDVRLITPKKFDFWTIHYDSTPLYSRGGWQYARLTFPIWMPFALSCIPPLTILVTRPIARRLRIRRRRRRGLCMQCGYSLRGNVSGVCPECGAPLGARS